MKSSPAFSPDQATRAEFDHSSDPNFLSYYSAASLSPATLERFRVVRGKLLDLAAQSGIADRRLRVADIGCGAGSQSMLWAELGHSVHGLDVNAPLIELGRKRAGESKLDIRFDVGTATSLPYADASMDVVMLPELLEHVADWQSCLDEAVRVLAPGGLLYLSTTNVMCPRQEEFSLPAYSWYPGFVKRRYERLALTTRPEIANYARYPAVNWFSHYSLGSFLERRGMRCLDRLDMMDRAAMPAPLRSVLDVIRRVPAFRWVTYFFLPATILFAIKQTP